MSIYCSIYLITKIIYLPTSITVVAIIDCPFLVKTKYATIPLAGFANGEGGGRYRPLLAVCLGHLR